jgi:UDP-N-acetylmuramate: L-alanyl-gamma-D-glutamyl-meso-diaminopimelate ligase
VKVIDDFGHHPTAIKQTVDALKHRYPTGKMCAIFEPRSNTTRRNIFQKDLPIALGAAEICILAPVADPHKVPEAERLNVQQVLDDIARMGRKAYLEQDVDAMVQRAMSVVEPGDTIVVFSNGGFGGIHQKLLDALAAKP